MRDERESESAGAKRSEAAGADERETRSALDLSAVLRVLDHPRRRYLVTTLVNGHSEAPLQQLAIEIAARERDKTVADVTERERDQVHTSLHHSHVPRLVDAGIVTYDTDDESVIRAANADRVREVLHSADVAMNGLTDREETSHDSGLPGTESPERPGDPG